MFGEESRPEIIKAATVAPDNDANGLPLIKRLILRIGHANDRLPALRQSKETRIT
jgi:hypothetical protein